MNATSLSLLKTIVSTDGTVSSTEMSVLQDLITGRSQDIPSHPDQPLLLSQKDTALKLGVSRVTIWRMTNEGILNPIEILSNTFRYRSGEIEAIARGEIAA